MTENKLNDDKLEECKKIFDEFDVDGGGHENACGCRIMPLDDGILVSRELNNLDIERNIKAWVEMWNTN